MTYQTVITAAGDSRPLFLPSGFGRPKSLVERDGAAVLVRAVASYAHASGPTAVAINREEEVEWGISHSLSDLLPQVTWVPVSTHVKGALVTAVIASAQLDADAPVVIAAGDSEIVGGAHHIVRHFQERGVAAGTIVFRDTSPRWSYISVDEDGTVCLVAEKEVVGPFATTGLFYFGRLRDFLDAAQWCLVNRASRGGLYYVSMALNQMLSQGHVVGYREISRRDYRPSALPVDFSMDSYNG